MAGATPALFPDMMFFQPSPEETNPKSSVVKDMAFHKRGTTQDNADAYEEPIVFVSRFIMRLKVSLSSKLKTYRANYENIEESLDLKWNKEGGSFRARPHPAKLLFCGNERSKEFCVPIKQ